MRRERALGESLWEAVLPAELRDFATTTPSPTAISYQSREAANDPQLVIETS